MHYLIDGHNLIAKIPDISLEDPDDEIQLILRLRSWTAASKKRQVTVYFDGGLPGGKNVKLSTPQVRVIFASAGKTADALIIKRMNQVKNPAEYTLVTTDQQIIRAASERKMKHMRSEKFAMRMGRQWEERVPGPTITTDDPEVSQAEISEWLQIFGPVDETALRKRPKPIPPNRPQPEPEPEPEPEPPKPPGTSNREDPDMSEAELNEWLEMFGGESASAAEKETTPDKPQKKRVTRKRKKAANPHHLNSDDLAAWQAFANRDE